MLRTLIALAALLAAGCVSDIVVDGAGPRLLAAHAHNDYIHARPLLDAVDQGFRSVEADVFAVDGALWVGHTLLEVRPGRTLRELYLEPLRERLQARGSVLERSLADDGGFFLLVDFKQSGEACLALLLEELRPLEPYLTRRVAGSVVPGELTVIVSGARPVEALRQLEPALVFLDARPAELDRVDRALAPLVSASWRDRFEWRGEGDPSAEDLARLRADAAAARAGGQVLRYWALPHDERVWRVALDEGVTLLQADDLERLARFLEPVRPARRAR
ncbi:MAG: hypothetical protein R3F49_05645 [Planctomycetota bacterium]